TRARRLAAPRGDRRGRAPPRDDHLGRPRRGSRDPHRRRAPPLGLPAPRSGLRGALLRRHALARRGRRPPRPRARLVRDPPAPLRPAAAGIERRRPSRVLVDIEVDYKSDETFLFAYITDISVMGIFVRTLTPAVTGTRLVLGFTPPGSDRRFDLEGVVAWVN